MKGSIFSGNTQKTNFAPVLFAMLEVVKLKFA